MILIRFPSDRAATGTDCSANQCAFAAAHKRANASTRSAADQRTFAWSNAAMTPMSATMAVTIIAVLCVRVSHQRARKT